MVDEPRTWTEAEDYEVTMAMLDAEVRDQLLATAPHTREAEDDLFLGGAAVRSIKRLARGAVGRVLGVTSSGVEWVTANKLPAAVAVPVGFQVWTDLLTGIQDDQNVLVTTSTSVGSEVFRFGSIPTDPQFVNLSASPAVRLRRNGRTLQCWDNRTAAKTFSAVNLG